MFGATKKIAIIATLIIVALAAAGYIWYQQDTASRSEDYLAARDAALTELADMDISTLVATASADDVINEASAAKLADACRQAEQLSSDLPDQVVNPDDADVRAAEEAYSLEDIRADARRYADTCNYYYRDADASRRVEAARQTSEYKSLLLEDCEASADCYDPAKKEEFIAYYQQNIIGPVSDKVDYYTEAECPFTIDGGEQFCNALGNYFRAEEAYYRVYIDQVEKDSAGEGDKQVSGALDAWHSSYDSLERLSKVLQHNGPNDVFVAQLREYESKFADHSS